MITGVIHTNCPHEIFIDPASGIIAKATNVGKETICRDAIAISFPLILLGSCLRLALGPRPTRRNWLIVLALANALISMVRIGLILLEWPSIAFIARNCRCWIGG